MNIKEIIIVSQRIQHIGMWHLFKIGLIPGTNFIINTDFVKSIGGWTNGTLTEDTDISFKIMQANKQIALAYNSEAFEQEPETLKSYYLQRKRWAKGNYDAAMSNLKFFFGRSNWRVKYEVFYNICVFFWFNTAVVISDIFFLMNLIVLALRFALPDLTVPFSFASDNIYLMPMLLLNWLLMILIYLLQINIAAATQFGQATTRQVWLAIISYFTYTQLFLIVSIAAVTSLLKDKIFKRDSSNWVKIKRFAE